ncbi:hypothetical protein YB2330_001585 [Saitoella coloradoensis]
MSDTTDDTDGTTDGETPPPPSKRIRRNSNEQEGSRPRDTRTEQQKGSILHWADAYVANGHKHPVSGAQIAAPAARAELKVHISSPFKLLSTRDLPPSENVDTIALSDILSDPLISCIWQFNFLFDIPFIYSHLDPDTADACSIKIVHGFWKTEDPTRHILYEEAERYKNVELVAAYLPDPFGTHHTKMMVVFKRDDTVQVIVHTANMIEKDWGNMTNAAWLSPPLPRKTAASPATSEFEADIMAYFAAYGRDRLRALMDEVKEYDFSSVKATFVASVPGKFTTTSTKRMWGIERMRDVLSQIPSTPDTPSSKDTIIGQFSSIGSLGPKDTWLSPYFHSVLSTTASSAPSSRKPPLKLIFPTPSSIKNSLEGWFSGGSIHLRLSTQQMQSQLEYMRPMLCDWHAVEAGRERAAPHIKTYMRLSEDEKSGVRVKWALLTSANLSKPAWGTPVAGRDPGFKIQSYEAGILIHPAQYLPSGAAVIVPTYKSDTVPDEARERMQKEGVTEIVPLRMPWDWPLKKYEVGDEPWTPEPARMEVDWRGMPWPGYGR